VDVVEGSWASSTDFPGFGVLLNVDVDGSPEA
jgi:hypothetical protein